MPILDKVTRDFLTYNSNVGQPDMFMEAQDPTYMSFRLDFFPDNGWSLQPDVISAGGLFRPFNSNKNDMNLYLDSAIDYLYNIGSPKRCAYLQAFASTLYKLQTKTPWFFQSISGLGDLYKIDKANSYRAKEKNITIDCLESIDMRMSFLADLYRNMAYDMETMKEILPVNLRTFNMNVYVLEFRRFNTTFGKLASLLKYNVPIKNKKDPMTRCKDYWKEGHKFLDSTVSMGSLDTFVTAGNQFINTFGGVGGMLLNDKDINVKELEYEFEAVTVHEFELHDCEFDFFSTEPDWMTTISNSDVSAPATAKMIIHPNRVHKVSHYPFFNFVIGEYIMKTLFNEYDIMNMYNNDFIKLDKLPDLYLERHPVQERNDITHSADGIFAEKRQSVYPVSEGYSEKTASAQAYIEQLEKSKELNRSNLQHSILNIGVDAINIGIGKIFENTTPGAVKQVTREGLTSFIPDQINKIL